MDGYVPSGCVIFGGNGISNDETIGVFKAKLNGWFNVWKLLMR